jgi:heat shock 70kDa protein 1/2/6/8
VAVIAIQEQLFEVKAMHGDTALGGLDYVKRLMEFCLHDFGQKNGEHILENKFAVEQLRVQCEMAKKALNKEGEARIVCPKLSNGKDLDVKISRQKYNELCEDLMQRCVPPIVMAMKDANVSFGAIDEIALVGDFTQTPMVTKMI